MTESTQYARDGTEYSSNMSSDVTTQKNDGNDEQREHPQGRVSSYTFWNAMVNTGVPS